jgi:predicted metal-dependent enzyme (double-stranded beta helix superfamily)
MSILSRRTFLSGATAALATACASPRPRTNAAAAAATTTAKFDLERFIAEVQEANALPDGQKAVHEVLARAVAAPRAVALGLGEAKPGIHALHRAPGLTILNVVWAPYMVLLPHDHRMWATIGIYDGREDNILWRRQGAVVEAADAASLSEKEVFSLPADAVHSVTNPIGRLTGAIHIYGGDFFATPRSEWDAETLRERPFDLERARQIFREANERYEAAR